MPRGDQERVCFVIAPIGEEDTDIRRRSDQVLNHIIAPAAEECGYSAMRADQISEPGIITSQVIQHLVEDPLVIADLTGWNPNVFYELAVRHAVRKPVVQIIQAGERIPFDVAGTRMIAFDHRDLDSAARCRDDIVRQIRTVEKDVSQVDTPISAAIDVQTLRASDNPLEKSSVEIMSTLQELRSMVARLPDALVRAPRFDPHTLERVILTLVRAQQFLTLAPRDRPTKRQVEKARNLVGEAMSRLKAAELGSEAQAAWVRDLLEHPPRELERDPAFFYYMRTGRLPPSAAAE